jgi:2-methylaconitate cis-trans-isomerase PrpF
MSFIHLDRNLEQTLIPITVIRGGTSRGFYFEGRNVPPQSKGLSRRAEG